MPPYPGAALAVPGSPRLLRCRPAERVPRSAPQMEKVGVSFTPHLCVSVRSAINVGIEPFSGVDFDTAFCVSRIHLRVRRWKEKYGWEGYAF